MRFGRGSSKVGIMMPRLKVVDLNPHLSCILCGGYFIDATTITECLHSFCRACIVRYLETSQYCPVCEVQVHKSKPLRSDKILQDIVYKLVPGLFHNEMKRRRELYASQPPEALKESRDAEDRGECLDEKFIYAPDEIFSLSIEYGKETENKEKETTEDDNVPRRRFLRCPASVTVGHLKKFVRMKYGIPNSYEVDLKYDEESLCDDYTLMDVAYIFLWERKGPMRFFYKIVERPPKKLKSKHIYMDDFVETRGLKVTELETKDTEMVEDKCTSSVQPEVPRPQSTKCSSEKDTSLPHSTLMPATESAVAEQCPANLTPKTVDVPANNPVSDKMDEDPEKSNITEPTKSNVTAPIKSSITVPIKSNVTVPIKSSVTVPIKSSVTVPIKSSVTESKKTSVTEPVKSNVMEPVKGNVKEPVKGNVKEPVKGSVKEPVKGNVIEPVKISVTESLKSNVTESVKSSVTDEPMLVEVCNSKELKSIPFKFPPTSQNKSPPSENKPAVMTVAPFIKPSSSLPTTSSTPASGTVTHGLYTGISIKKSPPNTLPPFKISAHLIPPRVPPLKLSPPRFSKLENCLRELSSSYKKSSASKKSKSSKGSSDKLELKVAQLKSASSFKYVAPLVISVPPEAKLDSRKEFSQSAPLSKKVEESPTKAPPVEMPREKEIPRPQVLPSAVLTPAPPPPPPSIPESKASVEDDKMDLDNDLFEGPLVIAEPDIPSKEDSNSSGSKNGDATLPPPPPPAPKEAESSKPPEDSEDEEIDVVDDGEVDSGRGSDISSRTEARSLCGDDDLGSPDSVPKTPEAERRPPPVSVPKPILMDPKQPTIPKTNGLVPPPPGLPSKNGISTSNGHNDCGVLDLSTCASRKRGHDGDGPIHRSKQVANPAVLDKSRQTTTPCISPNHSPFKVLSSPVDIVPHLSIYKSSKHHESSSSRGSGGFKCRGSNLAVINPNPNGNIPKLVIRNLGPRPDRGHERFHHHHHHHHNHNHHHQRM